MGSLDPLAWAVLLTVAGCALLVLEVFLPSGGVLSVLSLATFISGILFAFWSGGPTTGFSFIVAVLLLGPLTIGLSFYYMPRTRIGKALLGEVPTEEEVTPDDPRRALLGKYGVARTKMLPSGSVEIDDQMIDAIAHGAAIDPGQAVQVVEVRGNRVVVQLARHVPAAPDARSAKEGEDDDPHSRSLEELGIEPIDPLA
jgi:membrane-bound ClpP family serine protease